VVGERPVKLAVAGTASVDSSLAAALESPEWRTLQARSVAQPVTAYTAESKVTAAALRGEPDALVAVRITRPGGTTVATDPAQPADLTFPGSVLAETEPEGSSIDSETGGPAGDGDRRSGV
jgi:hypothetical protein